MVCESGLDTFENHNVVMATSCKPVNVYGHLNCKYSLTFLEVQTNSCWTETLIDKDTSFVTLSNKDIGDCRHK